MNSMKAVLYIGRWLYGLIFIMAGYTHFTAATRQYAWLAYGVPPWLTMLAGVAACVGGLCVATGFRPREGACLIAGFLVPTTIVFHRFWGLPPAMAADQMAHFMKNVSLFGAALMIVYQGSSPWGGGEPPARIEARRHTARRIGPRELLTPGTRL